MKKNEDKFIMLPTVDFCFCELMKNAKVRKGFVAALQGIDPEFIKETTLLPTILDRSSADDKQGILDVRILLQDETQMNMEMQVRSYQYWGERSLFYLGKMYTGQMKRGDTYEKLKKCIHVSILDFIRFAEDDICYRTFHFRDDKTGKIYSDKLEIHVLELKKLPKDVQTGEDIIEWMKFFSGKSREEFEHMARTNEYLDEAYQELKHLSADERKRLEYEEREKAIRDYNSFMKDAEEQGLRQGLEKGLQQGLEKGLQQGLEKGLEKGLQQGLEQGIQQGESNYARLTELLLKESRTDELVRAASDEEYRKKLYSEYGIK